MEKKCCWPNSPFILDWTIISLVGKQDRHKISDEFEFQPDQTNNFGVTCSWASEKNVVDTIASSFFIRSSSNLQVMRTRIKSWTSLTSGLVWPFPSELFALVCLKKIPLSYHGDNVVFSLACSVFSSPNKLLWSAACWLSGERSLPIGLLVSVGNTSSARFAHLSCLMTKPTKWHVHPAKTQISLGIRPVWS